MDLVRGARSWSLQDHWGTSTEQFVGEPGASEAVRSARRCRQALHTKAPVLR